MLSAPKSSNTARFDEVPETSKVDYTSYAKRERNQTQLYFKHSFARLVVEPTMFKQAMASLDAYSWQSAILAEYKSRKEAGIWTLHDMSDLPVRRQPVLSKWGFKVKHNADGSVA